MFGTLAGLVVIIVLKYVTNTSKIYTFSSINGSELNGTRSSFYHLVVKAKAMLCFLRSGFVLRLRACATRSILYPRVGFYLAEMFTNAGRSRGIDKV